MLDYRRIQLCVFLLILSMTACQSRPKSTSDTMPAIPVEVPLDPTQSMMRFMRTPSVIYFDPNENLMDITQSLEILSYEGAVFGWTVPLKEKHPQFEVTENLLQVCQDGRRKFSAYKKLIQAETMMVQNYREYDENEDCRGIYMYQILFGKEPVLSFKISIL